MLKVLIVDDHPLIRQGLIAILRKWDQTIHTEEAENGHQAVAMANEKSFQIIILDISIPKKNGLEVLKEIKIHKPYLPVLILTAAEEEEYGLRALKAGASGYITKKKALDELVSAVESIMHGEKYISPYLSASMVTQLNDAKSETPHIFLSDREYDIFLRLAKGQRSVDIAKDLYISQKTVYTYRVRILNKMNVKTNADLTSYALNHKLIDK